MEITTNSTAAPQATHVCMRARYGIAGTGASISGRVAAATPHADSVFVAAFLKDAFSGVRAWSPPVE